VILTIISIVIAYTVPTQWSMVLKRDRDRQTIFYMKQYARAILAWQKKHNSPPTSLEQLREAREPRMIRGGEDEWPCPLTGKPEDWILVPQNALVANAPGVPNPNQPNQPPPTNPATRPPGAAPGTPPVPGMMAAAKLNKELSPPDYKGPFVAVRPKARGKSFIALNEVEEYDEWVYTVMDLNNEIAARQAALTQQ
jgi:type II secretory pathway pseudopilin PulG